MLALILAATAFSSGAIAEPRRMVVLGIDGMDPTLLQGFIDEGYAPNLEKLAQRGGFMPLGTSLPPQSPVAWSNLITGMNPGGHGLYDFLALDRESMMPYLSSVRVERTLDWGTIELGDWRLPLIDERPVLQRDGQAFWEMLGEHGIPTRIFRIPANYPPAAAENNRQFSGMGTPDLRGSSGTFTFYTDDPGWPAGPVSGGEITRVAVRSGKVRSVLHGPDNPFLKDTPSTEVEFEVDIDAGAAQAQIRIGESEINLSTGEWSDWVAVNFEVIPSIIEMPGMVRFYLQQTEPNFRLYVSPVNIDPRAPAQPVATPVEYAFELSESAGPFYTQEMPEDTKALTEHVLSPGEFLDQSGIVLDERRRLLKHELAEFKKEPGSALMFFYVSSLDQRNHMLMRQMDPEHPFHEDNTPERIANAMRTTYSEIDEMVGSVMDEIGDETALVVMSDHGFSSFRTQVNLNTWLEQQGYLKLEDPDKREQYEWLDGIDWSQTRAFAIGLNSLYINVKGRERDGVVDPTDREALAREIAGKLGKWVDESTGQPIVTQPVVREDVYSGPHVEEAPDVLVGYASGYRASWATTSGEIPAGLLEPNDHEWSGDHCMDSTVVPGVLLSTEALIQKQGDLRDLTASIISYFEIEAPAQLEGKPVF
ncbi:MAG: alkaline phosphatase family protein [Gammaproteobacteria bacterium]